MRGYHISAAAPCRELYLPIAERRAGEYFLYWPPRQVFWWHLAPSVVSPASPFTYKTTPSGRLAAAIASLDMVVESDPLGSGRPLVGFK